MVGGSESIFTGGGFILAGGGWLVDIFWLVVDGVGSWWVVVGGCG